MGFKDVGFMGSKFYQTPMIDVLSKSGMTFTSGYAAAANCAPSRASIMTGRWTPRHGIYTVGTSERGNTAHRKLIPIENTITLSQTIPILPKILQKAGYHTIHAGKWHLSDDPLAYGFEQNIGGGHNGHPSSYYPPYGNVDLKNSGDSYLTDEIMDQTLNTIKTTKQPFFLNYAPYAVHTPIHPIDSLMSKYTQKASSNGQHNAEYATMIENLDRNVGRLIASLRKNKVYGNTLIIFTSDNGGLYGITKQPPLRAGKGSYYEGGIRVPFFFVWEGKIKSGAKSNIPISHLDLFPTILNATGIDTNRYAIDGADLLPITKGTVKTLDRALFWHFPIYLQAYNRLDNENRDSLFRTRPGSVIREGNWKLHYYFENDEMELYNIVEDPGERNDLLNTHPKMAEEMKTKLISWWKMTNAPRPVVMNPEYKD